MTIEFKLPELGENIESGEVVNVLVSAGDTIAPDQPVLELETDKATIEVPSSVSGTVEDILVKSGDTINVGQVVFTVAGTAAAEGAQAKPEAAAEPTQPLPERADPSPAAQEKPVAEKTQSPQIGSRLGEPTSLFHPQNLQRYSPGTGFCSHGSPLVKKLPIIGRQLGGRDIGDQFLQGD